jgi:hypothetical protein
MMLHAVHARIDRYSSFHPDPSLDTRCNFYGCLAAIRGHI